MNQQRHIVIGAGGHGCVVLDALLSRELEVIGFVDADPNLHGRATQGVPVLGSDAEILSFAPDDIRLVNGIGSTRSPTKRAAAFDQMTKNGYRFATVIHANGIVSGSARIQEGAQVMAGAVVQPGCDIGSNAIVNTRASIDHDVMAGRHAHIAPGATVSGNVTIGERAHVGAGATVIQNISIGARALVAAGAVVINDVGEDACVMGVPAKASV